MQVLNKGFKTFGFDQELGDCLYFCENFNSVEHIELKLHLEKAMKHRNKQSERPSIEKDESELNITTADFKTHN